MTYEELLQSKLKRKQETGFNVEGNWTWLYDFQKFCVKRALKVGRYALFEDCGLGKTRQQITWAHEVFKHTNKPVLILAPLAVVGQTIEESERIGLPVYEYGSSSDCNVYISNYEQLENINCSLFAGVVLDESSILKNFSGATRNKLVECFEKTPYKLCCTTQD
jgi:SNF2 family DNA or RNA helicase